MFVVVRHPDITVPGVIPVDALELHKLRGWFRVSEPASQPADFYLPDFADAEDLDAEPPTSRRSRAKEQ